MIPKPSEAISTHVVKTPRIQQTSHANTTSLHVNRKPREKARSKRINKKRRLQLANTLFLARGTYSTSKSYYSKVKVDQGKP